MLKMVSLSGIKEECGPGLAEVGCEDRGGQKRRVNERPARR